MARAPSRVSLLRPKTLASEPKQHGAMLTGSPPRRPRNCGTSLSISGWWAGQDSNLQPDRYERPALTIELPAPPEAAATPAGGLVSYSASGEWRNAEAGYAACGDMPGETCLAGRGLTLYMPGVDAASIPRVRLKIG